MATTALGTNDAVPEATMSETTTTSEVVTAAATTTAASDTATGTATDAATANGGSNTPDDPEFAKKQRKICKELRDLADFNRAPARDDGQGEETSPTSASTTTAAEVVQVQAAAAVPAPESRRSRRRSAGGNTTAGGIKPPPKKAKTTSSSTTRRTSTAKKEQDQLEMAWICVACREAECAMNPDSELLVCEGACKRLFHTTCAGLAQTPPEEVTWKCHDCENQKHLCGFCHQYGIDNEELFKCQRPECGHFFHEACLEMNNIVIANPTTEINNSPDEATPKMLKFTCPAHSCWTCTQVDLAEAEEQKGKAAKGRGKGKRTSLFSSKRDSRLFFCLECPISYHLTCIPPLAKFHELALLCHEHADKAELPTLDLEASYQGSVEARCDKKLQKIKNWENLLAKRAKNRRHSAGSSKAGADLANPFFPRGVVADQRTNRETFVLGKLASAEATNDDDAAAVVANPEQEESAVMVKAATDWMCGTTSVNHRMLFSLPADIQEEVHSKPPLYKHIHALKYYPDNKPKRIPTSKDVCNCVDTCDDHCLNRLLYTECFGEKGSRGTNCRLGANCGNRSLGQRKHVKKCKPKREQGKGWGLVTLEAVPKGALVQEYLGDVIDETEKERRLQTWNAQHPNDPNYYIMCLSQGWYVDARETANLARFINHSCDPNCILLRFNVGGFMRDGIFALRNIQPGEFLSYDYHFDTKRGDKFLCRCGSKNCRGTMKEENLDRDNGAPKKTARQLWNEAKQQYEKDEKFLAELAEREKQNATVGALLPGTDKASEVDEWVSNGVQKDRGAAIRNRIFLWRNAVKGSDFEARFGRYDLPTEGTEGAASSSDSQAGIRRKRPKRQKPAATTKPKETVDVLAIVVANSGAEKKRLAINSLPEISIK